MSQHLLDLGVGEVHAPSLAGGRKRDMAEISTKTRNALPAGKFALPGQRKYPIHDRAHAANAAARLEQAKKAGKISDADYAKAHAAIKRAEKRLGVGASRKSRDGARMRIFIDHPKHGRVEVRHMSELGVVTCRVPLPLPANAAGDVGEKKWVQIAKSGHFEGHRAGPFDLNESIFSDIVRNFREVDGGEVAFDFEHASEQDPTEGSIPEQGAPAQGWIRDLKIDGGNLLALVEWLEPARSYIRDGKYKHVSPAIRFNAKHPVTGKNIGARLTSVALTNTPFLRGMKPLAAKDTDNVEEILVSEIEGATVQMAKMGGAFAYSSNEYMPKLRAALRLGDLATAAECRDQFDRVCGYFKAADYNPDATIHGVSLSQYCMALRAMSGASMGAKWSEVFDIVEDLIDAAIEEHEIEEHGAGPDLEDDDEDTMRASSAQETTANGEPPAAQPGDNAMADQNANATSTQLKDLEDKVTKLSAGFEKMQTENATLRLDLKEAQGKVEAAETELKTLRDEKTKRDAADEHARVDEAFDVYKDKKNLTEDDKASMLIELRADRDRFEKRYPKVKPSERHMLRDLAGTSSKAGTPRAQAPHLVEGGQLNIAALKPYEIARVLMKNDEKLSYSDAINKATRIYNEQKAASAA